MKKFLNRLLLATALITLPLTPAMTCSQSQQRITYNTLYSVGAAVNTAYAAYNDKVVSGQATFNVSVAKAYNDFQAGFAVAVQAAQMNTASVAPQSLVDLANAVYVAIKQYTK